MTIESSNYRLAAQFRPHLRVLACQAAQRRNAWAHPAVGRPARRSARPSAPLVAPLGPPPLPGRPHLPARGSARSW